MAAGQASGGEPEGIVLHGFISEEWAGLNKESTMVHFDGRGHMEELVCVIPDIKGIKTFPEDRTTWMLFPLFSRNGEAWRFDRLILNKEVLSPQVMDNFVPLLNEVGEDFVRRVRVQIEKSGRGKWTADFTNELFRFALECE